MGEVEGAELAIMVGARRADDLDQQIDFLLRLFSIREFWLARVHHPRAIERQIGQDMMLRNLRVSGKAAQRIELVGVGLEFVVLDKRLYEFDVQFHIFSVPFALCSDCAVFRLCVLSLSFSSNHLITHICPHNYINNPCHKQVINPA